MSFVLFPLVIWTGLAMSPAIASAFPAVVTVFSGRQSARTIHFFVSMFLLLFVLSRRKLITGLAAAGASGRLLTRQSLAREFPRSQISKAPFANGTPPQDTAYERLQAGAFADWRLAVDGMVARPASFSLAELRSQLSRSQITHLACEEGWYFIAEWTRAPLSHVLNVAGVLPQVCCLFLDTARLVGQHRYGRCIASSDSCESPDNSATRA